MIDKIKNVVHRLGVCIILLAMPLFLVGFAPVKGESWTVSGATDTHYFGFKGKGSWSLEVLQDSLTGADPTITISISNDLTGCTNKPGDLCTTALYAAKDWTVKEAVTADELTEMITFLHRNSGVALFFRVAVSGNTNPRSLSLSLSHFHDVVASPGG